MIWNSRIKEKYPSSCFSIWAESCDYFVFPFASFKIISTVSIYFFFCQFDLKNLIYVKKVVHAQSAVPLHSTCHNNLHSQRNFRGYCSSGMQSYRYAFCQYCLTATKTWSQSWCIIWNSTSPSLQINGINVRKCRHEEVVSFLYFKSWFSPRINEDLVHC